MSELVAYYKAQVTPSLAQDALSTYRQHALSCLDALGFPTKSDEAWKYSAPLAWQKERFIPARPSRYAHPPIAGEFIHIGFDGDKITISHPLPEGVVVMSFQDAQNAYPEVVMDALGTLATPKDGFTALNASMANAGVVVMLAPGSVVTKPMVLSHYGRGANQAYYWRHLVLADVGSQATIVEDYQGDEAAYFTSSITEILLKPDATIHHYKLQSEGASAYHVSHVHASLVEGSVFESHLLNLGGSWVRTDTTVHLTEPNAKAFLNGIYLPCQKQHHDQHVSVVHEAGHCQSEQDYKGVLSDTARGVFDGRIVVMREATATEAHQQNKNLLLSHGAEVNTKPQLEIDTDEVVCSHGATVGQLSQEALFYLATRGISKAQGSMLLINAFANANMSHIKNEALKAECLARLTTKLESGHGCSAGL